jgi:hypothetical protein
MSVIDSYHLWYGTACAVGWADVNSPSLAISVPHIGQSDMAPKLVHTMPPRVQPVERSFGRLCFYRVEWQHNGTVYSRDHSYRHHATAHTTRLVIDNGIDAYCHTVTVGRG